MYNNLEKGMYIEVCNFEAGEKLDGGKRAFRG
jgi:hypothetical protein